MQYEYNFSVVEKVKSQDQHISLGRILWMGIQQMSTNSHTVAMEVFLSRNKKITERCMVETGEGKCYPEKPLVLFQMTFSASDEAELMFMWADAMAAAAHLWPFSGS